MSLTQVIVFFCWWMVLPPYWWLLTDQGGVAGGWGGCGSFLKIRHQWSLQTDWFFRSWTVSLEHATLFDSIWPTVNFFQNCTQLSQILPLLYQLSWCNISIPCCHFDNLHSVFTRSGFTSVVTSSAEVSNPSKSSVRSGINFLQTPVNIDILTSSMNHQCS